ncbi:hypothetical protein [Actinoplanes sp. NPDC026619]|uniref:hypothetical protein n=1 Tax=Actinoplanes sp. NPDC026619 TaxID=3155798 RepID=UPI0033EEDA5F
MVTKKRRWMFVAAAAIALVALGATIAQGTGTHLSVSVSCDAGEASCRRLISDVAHRKRLSAAETSRGNDESSRITGLLSGAKAPGELRTTLIAAGYPDPTVRTAGDDDIGPTGSIIAAVPIGAACVVAIQAADEQSSMVLGQNSAGACL